MLTDTAVRNAKPSIKPNGDKSDKPYKLPDAGGMYLLVMPAGGKLWRYDYRFEGKRKTLALGSYPDVSLATARERHVEARKLLANGVDPSANRQAKKAGRKDALANSFEVVGREWYAKHIANASEKHRKRVLSGLERFVFPWLGSIPVSDIKPVHVTECISRIEKLNILETAHRTLQDVGRIMRYAAQTGRAERDITQDLRGALPPTTVKHMATMTDPKDVAELLRAFDGFKGTLVVKIALKLAPMLFCRPGALRTMRWADINFEEAVWIYVVRKGGKVREFLTPLPRQALALLGEIKPLTGHSQYVFPNARSCKYPMSDAAINAALRRMGYDTKTEITGHGFRAMARTMTDEQEELEELIDPKHVETQLSHKAPDPSGLKNAYIRGQYIKQRRAMMQTWADYLDELKAGAKVIPLNGKAA